MFSPGKKWPEEPGEGWSAHASRKDGVMNGVRRGRGSICGAACVAALLVLMTVTLSSCGGTDMGTESTGADAVKLPPGVNVSDTGVESGTGTATEQETAEEEAAEELEEATSATPAASTVLAGGSFRVVKATRSDTNRSVISSSGRTVKGDYLELELAIENAATTHLVDLSEYSFRLESPGIGAGSYYNYYGNIGTYGKYVTENVISASLLDYSTLAEVSYLLKVGESIDGVFLFFDLNPENVGRNPGVTKENTSLVIRKVSGSEYGTTVSVPLAGYPD